MATNFLSGLKRAIVGYIDSVGSFYPSKIIDGNPRVVNNPYYFEISIGNIANHTSYHLVGEVSSAGDVCKDFTTIAGVDYIPLPAAAEQLKILSTSSQDVPGGTGAFTVEISGLDSNYDIISEVCTLNGITAITTTNTYFRINNTHVMSVGTNLFSVGNISFQSSGGTVFSNILAGENIDLNINFTIPRSYRGIIVGWGGGGITGNTTTKGQLSLLTTTDPNSRNTNTNVRYIERIIEFNNSTVFQQIDLPIKVPPTARIISCIKRSEGASTVSGNVSIDFFLDPA